MNEQLLKTLSRLSPNAQAVLRREIRRSIERHDARRALWRYYPDSGPLARDKYPKHMEFFAAGAEHFERAIIAANRSGKSTAAGYELTLHLTGRYPEWWIGRRFTRPVQAWASGEDIRSVRESIQPLLFGKLGELGTGMIPGDDIVGQPTAGRGVPDSIDSAIVAHQSGGQSRIVLKTYEQGRESFQAAQIDVGWCDEEPPQNVYTEFLTRLMSTTPGQSNGLMMCTFTPLKGMSSVVQYFLGDDWKSPEAPIEPSDWKSPDEGGYPADALA